MNKVKTLVLGIDGLWPELIEKYLETDIIPNIAKLVREGVFLRMLPLPPCDTPTNWVSLVTGASPGRHCALGFNVHIPGQPLDQVIVPDTKTIRAEFIWDVAERSGKLCILVNWPFSWPPTLKKGIVIAGTGPGDPRWRIEYGCIYTTDPRDPREIEIHLKPAEEWTNIPTSYSPPLETTLPLRIARSAFIWTESGWEPAAAEVREATPMSMRYKENAKITPLKEGKQYYVLVLDSKGHGYDTVIVSKQKDARQAVAKLSKDHGAWSEWIYDKFNFKVIAKYHGARISDTLTQGPLEGAFKLKLIELSSNGRRLTIFRTDIFRLDGWIYPEDLLPKVIEHLGPYCEGLELVPLITLVRDDWDTYFDLLKEQTNWFTRAYKYFSERYDWDMFFMQLHVFDALNHFLLRGMCEKSPDYDYRKANKILKIYERTLMIVDDLVGELLKLNNKNVNVIIVSDHGALPTWKLVWPGTALMKYGLLRFKEVNGKLMVDWENTKAFPWVMDIWVNLRGRFPHGVVAEDEYNKVVDEIVDALYSLRDPETGERIIASVVTKREGVFFGLYGDYTADVYYFFKPPYTDIDVHRHKILELALSDIENLLKPQLSKTVAAHDHFLPNERMDWFSNYAILIMWGPNVKKALLGKPVYTIDLAPTLCFLHKIPFPAQCEGRILFEVIDLAKS
ncbi:MAG: alkaline phosphatase family protein [Nitrososphaerota archaeon]